MSNAGKTTLAAASSGLLFGAGLVISGMTDPAKVLGFLDFFGNWDGRLMFVMGGAIAVNAPLTWWIRRRHAPVLQPSFRIPVSHASWRDQIDMPLVLGSALFGIGWGLSGYCPGPAIVSVSSLVDGSLAALTFTSSMIVGMAAFAGWERRRTEPKSNADGSDADGYEADGYDDAASNTARSPRASLPQSLNASNRSRT
jgi:uncharacterized membrane protein YedE/YeeE